MTYVGNTNVIFAIVIRLAIFAIIFLLPIILGFTYVRSDANRLGQPGWLWAVLTIPLSWLALLAYVVVRALTSPRR